MVRSYKSSSTDSLHHPGSQRTLVLQDTVAQPNILVRAERAILDIIASYAFAVTIVFSLSVLIALSHDPNLSSHVDQLMILT